MDPVIIVGAGPVGLALSLALAAQDVPSVVLDETAGKEEPRPARTVVLRADMAALVERLGCTTLRDEGVRWVGWRSLRRKQQTRHVALDLGLSGDAGAADGTEGPPAPLHIPQHALARGLRDAIARQKLVTLVTDARVDAVEQDAHGVGAHTRGPEGTWWRGSHLVGCDGARSTVRKLLGVRFAGRTAVERHAVAALRTELPWAGEALLHRQPPWRGAGEEITARPLPDGVWRIDWLLPPRGDLVTPDALVTRIRDTLAGWCEGTTPPYDLIDTGVHTVHHRLARRWRIDRVFLAGDAAHLLGAVGTQGFDEGLRDVDNLAWKLAHSRHHRDSSPTLLDSYQSERRAAVAARLRAADQSLPALRGGGGLRTYLPGGGRAHDTLLTDGHLGRGPLGAPPAYPHSPAGRAGVRGAHPGGHARRSSGGGRPGDGARRHDRATAGPAGAGAAARRPRRPGDRGVGPAALDERRRDATARRGGGRAAGPRRAPGDGGLPGRPGPRRPAGPPGRAPGRRLRRGAPRGAARRGGRGTGRKPGCRGRVHGQRPHSGRQLTLAGAHGVLRNVTDTDVRLWRRVHMDLVRYAGCMCRPSC